MNRIIFLVVFSLLSISCNAKDKMNNIEIDNIVSNCISFTKNNMETYGNLWKLMETYGNLLILNTTWLVNNNIGSCGCKSAALKYTVKMDDDKLISLGHFSTLNKSSFKFVINNDINIYKKSNFRLVVDCG